MYSCLAVVLSWRTVWTWTSNVGCRILVDVAKMAKIESRNRETRTASFGCHFTSRLSDRSIVAIYHLPSTCHMSISHSLLCQSRNKLLRWRLSKQCRVAVENTNNNNNT